MSLEGDGGLSRGRGGVLVLIAVLALAGIRVATAGLASPLPALLQDLVTLAISVIIESLPFVVLGVLLSVVVQLWLPEGLLLRLLPRRGILRRAAVSLLGVLMPVCECGNVPLARGLLVSGLSVGEATTFLLAAPIVNPITIVTTWQAFGLGDGVLVARIAGGFLLANLVGAVISTRRDGLSLLTERFAAACSAHGHDHDHDHGGRMRRSGELLVAELGTMVPALFLGALVAAGIQVIVPRSVLVALGANPLLSVLAMLALAFVISVCSNVDAFFVLPFASTFLPGGIVAFLVFGPLVDVKMISLMRTTYRGRALAVMAAIVALASLALGLAVNLGV
ncbi:MAG: permease [Microbacteriaceae bacterium]